MVNLMCGLAGRGHEAGVFQYYPQRDFYRPRLESAGVRVHLALAKGGFSLAVLRSLRALIQNGQYDAVISFLDSPNLYAELAGIGRRRTVLLVSERSSRAHDSSRAAALLKRGLHWVADRVVCNSHAHAAWLRQLPWCKNKVVVIYNGIEIPARPAPPARGKDDALQLLVIGRVGPEKNAFCLMEALKILGQRNKTIPFVRWVGGKDTSTRGLQYWERIRQWMEGNPDLRARWEWMGERQEAPALLATADALVLCSFYEGLPNVVCEAFAMGRIVLASHVCEHPRLVADGVRGFLFDPSRPETLADAIERLEGLDAERWSSMSASARSYAEQHLKVDRMVLEFEQLLLRCIEERR